MIAEVRNAGGAGIFIIQYAMLVFHSGGFTGENKQIFCSVVVDISIRRASSDQGATPTTLAASGTVGVASCSVNYTPSVTGSHGITVSYAGDSSHLGSGGSTTLTVVGAVPQPTYSLVVSTDGKVSRLYQNGTLTLIGQPVTTPLRSVGSKSVSSMRFRLSRCLSQSRVP